MDLHAAAAALVAELAAGGVAATVDLRGLNPPAVLVLPPELTWRFGKGSWDATWTLWAAVPDAGAPSSIGALGALLEAVQAALSGRVASARPITITLADGATVPAYAATFTQRIPA